MRPCRRTLLCCSFGPRSNLLWYALLLLFLIFSICRVLYLRSYKECYPCNNLWHLRRLLCMHTCKSFLTMSVRLQYPSRGSTTCCHFLLPSMHDILVWFPLFRKSIRLHNSISATNCVNRPISGEAGREYILPGRVLLSRVSRRIHGGNYGILQSLCIHSNSPVWKGTISFLRQR